MSLRAMRSGEPDARRRDQVRRVIAAALVFVIAAVLTARAWRTELARDWIACTVAILAGATFARPARRNVRPRFEVARIILRGALVIGLVGWTWFRPPPPMGSGPAGPPVRTERFASIWSDGPTILL